MLKKIHRQMISVFGKNYGEYFGAILNGILFTYDMENHIISNDKFTKNIMIKEKNIFQVIEQ